ncbi:MAG: hypothetical protein CVV03_03840 [Firmicutes bacterium HGW-Firmicutes-8]|nr:MAG: hypothetical protein CVV03_03840 [Firmicutes bacterium HGW-Firmicutes-8]
MELDPKPESLIINSKIVSYFTVICGLIVFLINFQLTDLDLWSEVALFALLAFLSQLMPTRLPQGADFSVTFILDLVLIALYGIGVAVATRFVVTLGAGLFSKLLGSQNSLLNIAITTGQVVLIVGIAGTFYQLAGHQILAFAIGAVVYFIVATFFIALDGVLVFQNRFGEGWVSIIQTLYLNFFVLSSLAYLLTYIVRNSSPDWKLFGVLLFFVPVMLVNYALRLSVNIKQSYSKTVKTIAAAIEAKDPYMKGHSEQVAELTLAMAKEFRLPRRELQKLEYIALLHDAGKIGVRDEILNKPGPLSAEEYEEVKKHSALGADIIQKIKFLSSKSDIVLYHHERFDGSGYPAGLKGLDIPLEARIMGVADAYNAMVTDRPFRPARTPEQAVEEMVRLAGIQFDPNVVEKIKIVLKRRGEYKGEI